MRLFTVFGLTIAVMLPLLWQAVTSRHPAEQPGVMPRPLTSKGSDPAQDLPDNVDKPSTDASLGTGSGARPASDAIVPKSELSSPALQEHRSDGVKENNPLPMLTEEPADQGPKPVTSSMSVPPPQIGIETKRQVPLLGERRNNSAHRSVKRGAFTKQGQAARAKAGWVNIMRNAGWLGHSPRR